MIYVHRMSKGGNEAILYELICCAEWTEEKEQVAPFDFIEPCGTGVLARVNHLRNKGMSTSEALTWLRSLGPPWHYAVTSDGKIIAILQNTTLEMRSSKDNFASVVGKTHVVHDPYLNSRSMVWSKDSSFLAVSFTNGHIIFFDVIASQVCSVRRFGNVEEEEISKPLFLNENALAGMFFVEERLRKTTYLSELVTVDERGIIKSFRQVNADEVKLHHEGSLRAFYPKGVTNVQYSDTHSLLLVSGPLECDTNADDFNVRNGITAWRILQDHPYYKIAFLVEQNFRLDSRKMWKMAFSALTSSSSQDTVLKMTVSPSGNFILAIHISGAVSVWHIPSLKLHSMWPLKKQFQSSTENPRFNHRWRTAFNRSQNRVLDPWRFHPYDVSWWDDENVIISRVNGCVSLLPVTKGYDSVNRLGDSPELFESPVRLTSRFDKGFFAFEAEVRAKVENPGDPDSQVDGKEFWPKVLAQEFLFWVTDAERFRPARKRKKKTPVWRWAYRLFTLRNITPQELFHRKIEQLEYGEALDLAKVYKLDSDLVYQRQWTRDPVSVTTIKDYLGKIQKRNWVLQECLDRVPETIDACRELLQFGLKGTDLTVAVMISQGKDKGRFIYLSTDDLDISEEEYMSLVDPTNKEVLRLLHYRKQFLHFLDVLNTYEQMVGGPALAEDNYDCQAYGKLRSRSLVYSAVEMARNCDMHGLRILLTNHWHDVSDNYMDIISSFPETCSPHDFREFLPEIDETGNVLLWEDIASKEKDWCEEFLAESETDSILLNASKSRKSEITARDIETWYLNRICEIEKLSGMTNYALDLGLLGLERNILEVKPLVQDLQTVETLVYEVEMEHITLDQLKSLSDIERLNLLLSKSSEETLVQDFKHYVVPFLSKCEDREEGSQFRLLNAYLTSRCTEDLLPVLKVFEASKREEFDPIISELEDLMVLACNCIYACKSTNQNDNILVLLGCLPKRGYGDSGLDEYHDRVDELEVYYKAVKLLQKYQVSMTVLEMKQLSERKEDKEINEFFISICRTASKMDPPMKLNEWKTLLYDILELQKQLFRNLAIERCFEVYVTALLRSGSAEVISLSKDFLEDSAGVAVSGRRTSSTYSTSFALYLFIIPYTRSLEMVLEAAQMYFDSASNYLDPDIELAKTCLNLLQNSKEASVLYLFDLMDAIRLLNKDFQLNILPYSVRVCKDKIGLLRQALENIDGGYKKIKQLLKLTILLHIDNLDIAQGESIILEMAGTAALEASDWKYGVQICQSIMGKGYQTGWNLFTQLAKFQSDPPIMDPDNRLAFINYALTICPDKEILSVMNTKYLIEIGGIQSRLTELSPDDSAVDVEMLKIQGEESIVHDTLNKIQIQEFLKTTTRWINPLKEMAEVVKASSDALLTGRRHGLNSRLESDSSLDIGGAKSLCTSDNSNEKFEKESHPAFYLSEEQSRFMHTSILSYQYNSFSNASSAIYTQANPGLELCILHNRIWHLERLILGSEEAGARDKNVMEQLVCGVLSQDLPWGLAILFSIDDNEIEMLSYVLSKLPASPVATLVILYQLALRIQKSVLGLSSIADDGLCFRDPNKIISQTSEILEDGDPQWDDGETSSLPKLTELYREYEARLNDFR